MRSRKIIVYIATSADGFIARPDGSVDWLERPDVEEHYQAAAFFNSIDTVFWGRKTYDFALGHGGVNFGGMKMTNYVFSSHPPQEDPDDVIFVREPVPDFATRLRKEEGKDIWMMGGAEIIRSFLDIGEIDEFIIHVIPVMIGEGIPLAAPNRRNIELELIDERKFPDGVVKLHYRVRR